MSDDVFQVPAVIPLFPLPETVLFPRMLQPLHVFEPRYRQMVADVIADHHVFGLALLKPGWEPLYHTPRAPIHETTGVGRIVAWEQDPKGNYNILLRGIARAVVLEELPGAPYRQARVEPLVTYCSGGDESAGELRAELFAAIRGNPALDVDLRRGWLRLRNAGIDLDALADLLAAAVPAEVALRQMLLAEPDALERGRMLLAQFQALAGISRTLRATRNPHSHGLN